MLDIPVLVLCGSHQRNACFTALLACTWHGSHLICIHFRESSESSTNGAICAASDSKMLAHIMAQPHRHLATARPWTNTHPMSSICLRQPLSRSLVQAVAFGGGGRLSSAAAATSDQQTPVDVDAVRLQRVSRQNPFSSESPPAATSAGPHVRYLRPSEASSAE